MKLSRQKNVNKKFLWRLVPAGITGEELRFTPFDFTFFFVSIVACYFFFRLVFFSPEQITGPEIFLDKNLLPWYGFLSFCRMAIAYSCALVFSISFSYFAVKFKKLTKFFIALLDLLQSMPILSFLPLVALSFAAIMPSNLAVELSAIVLIFSSQAWNMTYSFYQSLITLPNELKEAAVNYRFSAWQKFKTLELPFAATGLIWNSMMSWAGGWFFLMASETFTVGEKDFRLPGLGSYIQAAVAEGNKIAIFQGIAALFIIIILLDQFVWRPLIVWTERFRMDTVSQEEQNSSWFFDACSRSHLVKVLQINFLSPLIRLTDKYLEIVFEFVSRFFQGILVKSSNLIGTINISVFIKKFLITLVICAVIFLCVGLFQSLSKSGEIFIVLAKVNWLNIFLGLIATFLRVAIALTLTLAWAVPVGILIGANRRVRKIIQPFVQIFAAIPPTAFFPIMVMVLFSNFQQNVALNIAAVFLMLAGTQWYVLFNVIAGTAAIPKEMLDSAKMLGMSLKQKCTKLYIPALFPYIVTGSIASAGGAWNASVVAEYTQFSGRPYEVVGVGAVIAKATSTSDYYTLFAATAVMSLAVIILNRTFWRYLFKLAEEQYRMD